LSAVLISAEELRKELADKRVRLLDVRWALGDPDGPQHYLDGHIPGAVFVDLETELAAPPSPARGRHPLPDLAALQKCARSWGIREGDPVVVYDATGGMAAARAWWLLRWAGLADVRILDGGLPAWTAAGGATATGAEPDPEPGDVTLTAGNLPVVDADGAAKWPGVLLDARAAPRFRGETEPLDRVAGHVPGARNRPYADNLADGRFKSPEALRREFEALLEGRDPSRLVAMCGSGVTACHHLLAMEHAGLRGGRLYTGSWSGWISDPARPVATGP